MCMGVIGKGKKKPLKLECGWCAHCRRVNTVILNWPRPLWEGDYEVVKKSGRDEPLWVAIIQKCTEATLGISLYSYLYLKLAKTLYYYLLCCLFNKIGERGGGRRMGEVAQTMYTHISKCKNDKIQERKIIIKSHPPLLSHHQP
jgi:hypothetical protein